MGKELMIFSNEEFGSIRTVEDGDKVLFVASDIAKALKYSNTSKAIKDHCRWVTKRYIPHPQNENKEIEVNTIPEGDLYRLISNSELPSAEKFESWVFDEVLPTIRKTGGYVNNDELFINTYLPYADDQTTLMFKTTLETVRKQNELIKKQQDEIEHKEDVIIGLVDTITLAEKRQILSQVVRYNHANYSERWSVLYREFENKYHINLKQRFEKYNETHKPKCKSKVDYIDKVMDKIPELYEIAAKLFEADVKALVDELYRIAS